MEGLSRPSRRRRKSASAPSHSPTSSNLRLSRALSERLSERLSVTVATRTSSRRVSISGCWVEDTERADCTRCHRTFTLVHRRHHCRICGQLVCGNCSKGRLLLPSPPPNAPTRRKQRVCDDCLIAYTRNASSALSEGGTTEPLSESSSDSGCSSTYESDHLDGLCELHDSSSIASCSSTRSSFPLSSSRSLRLLTQITHEEPDLRFMVISVVCFALSFWILKDEVAPTNPAIWILLLGLVKNVLELVGSLVRRHFYANQRAQAVCSSPSGRGRRDDEPKTEQHPKPRQSRSPSRSPHSTLNLSTEQKSQLISKANQATDFLWKTGMETHDGWIPEVSIIEGVTLHSRDARPNRVYKCETVVEISPEEMFEIMYTQFERGPEWNVTGAESKILEKLNDCTDVVHMTSKPALGGMITSRDFVNVRQLQQRDGARLVSMDCAGAAIVSVVQGVVRAENGACGFIILPCVESAKRCRFVWIVNCDIKGFFPSSLIRKGSLSEMALFVRNLRRHLIAIGKLSRDPLK